MSIIYKYNNVVSTVVIETTSSIKLEINGFNRVLNISSSTEKGKILKEEVTHIPIDVYKLCKTDEVDLINLKQQLDKLLNILD